MIETKAQPIRLRPPVSQDGAAVFKLVSSCPPLDPNSLYCNLLQATHFASTSVAADMDDELVGFISGYRLPNNPETLFIWQVAVGERARGQGLATRMVRHILERPENAGVTTIETTITEDNQASWALFTSLAKKLDADLSRQVMFDKHDHFAGQHATEMLVTIRPVGR